MTGWRELVDGGPTWPLRRQSGRELELLLEDGRLRQDPRQSSVTRHDEPPPAAGWYSSALASNATCHRFSVYSVYFRSTGRCHGHTYKYIFNILLCVRDLMIMLFEFTIPCFYHRRHSKNK